VVISDLIMNDMNGIELLARVKELEPITEVIIITGSRRKRPRSMHCGTGHSIT